MKFKVNLKADGIKGLALQHGEKAAFGFGVLMLLYFIYAAAGTEVLGPDKQPEKLSQAAEQAKQYVLNSKWNPKAKNIEVVDYVSRAKRDPLDDRDYRVANLFNKPLWELKGKRTEPTVLALEKPQAAAGIGIFALAPPEAVDEDQAEQGPRAGRMHPGGPMGRGPNGQPRGPAGQPRGPAGQPVPEGEQPETRPARGRGNNEIPRGVRASAFTNLKGLGWAAVTGLVPVKKQEDEFEDVFRNVLAQFGDKDLPDYILPRIERAEVQADGKPGPWQGIDLGSKSFTAKLISQWQGEYPEVVEEAYVDRLFTMPLGPLVNEDWNPNAVAHPDVPLVQKRNAKQVVEEASDEDEEEEEGGLGKRPPGARRSGYAASADPMQRPKMRSRSSGPARVAVDFSLFRFIDYSVLPGHQYQYRVMLRVKNPNFEVAEKFLKDPASRKKKYLESTWSEPTPLVAVPREISVLAGSVPKYTPRDPQIKMIVHRTDLQSGRKLAGEETYGRGTLVDFRKDVWVREGENEVLVKDAAFPANAVVVDIDGGKPLNKNRRDNQMAEPAEVLVLQADGRLVAHDELDDEPQVQENEPSKDSAAMPGAPGAPAAAPTVDKSPYDQLPRNRSKAAGAVELPPKKVKKPKVVPPPPVEKPPRKKAAA